MTSNRLPAPKTDAKPASGFDPNFAGDADTLDDDEVCMILAVQMTVKVYRGRVSRMPHGPQDDPHAAYADHLDTHIKP